MVEYHQASFKAAPVPTASSHYHHYRLSQVTRSISLQSLRRSGNTFLLLRRVIEAKELDLMAIMLKKILDIKIPEFPNQNAKFQFFAAIMAQTGEELAFAKNPSNSHLAISHFFQTIIWRHILPALGTAPKPENGTQTSWTLPELKCAISCGDCRSVSIFLISSHEQARTWTLSKAKRTHIMSLVKTQYSRFKNPMLSETQPPGRVGILSVKKIGMTYTDKIQAWNRRIEIVGKSIMAQRNWLGESDCTSRIVATLAKGGHGRRMARKAFPMTASQGNQPVITAAAVDVAINNSALTCNKATILSTIQQAGTAFLGYGFVHIDDVTFDLTRQRPTDAQIVHELLSKFQQI